LLAKSFIFVSPYRYFHKLYTHRASLSIKISLLLAPKFAKWYREFYIDKGGCKNENSKR